jgi:aspartyl protease family protein
VNGGDQALNFVYLLGCLTLAGSALLVRRFPIGQGLKMALAWVLIFGAAFAIFALRDDFLALGTRLIAETGEGRVVQAGGEVRIRKSLDGHFWADADLNGNKVHFLVDSGATMTTISSDTARDAHIDPDGHIPVLVDTANGVARVESGSADRLVLGTIERRNIAIEISPVGQTNVLGMNFLSSLSAWTVKGEWLVLKP